MSVSNPCWLLLWAFENIRNVQLLPVSFDNPEHTKKPLCIWENAVKSPEDPRISFFLYKRTVHGRFTPITVWGLLTKPAGLIVIDCDINKETGEEIGLNNWQNFLKEHNIKIPQTFTVVTRSGGLHFYFWAGKYNIKTCGGELGFLKNVDIRAGGGPDSKGGMIIAPYSSYTDKKYDEKGYMPVLHDGFPSPIQLIPDNLAAVLPGAYQTGAFNKKKKSKAVSRPVPCKSLRSTANVRPRPAATRKFKGRNHFASRRWEKLQAKLEAASPGERNNTLSLVAGQGYLMMEYIPELEIDCTLSVIAKKAGLSETEIKATMASALRWSLNQEPRRPPY